MTIDAREGAVVITGACAGIGESAARAFAARGFNVALVSQRPEELEAAAEWIRSRAGKATAFATDLSQPQQVASLIKRVESQMGPVTILMNNAGIGLGATVLQTSMSDVRRLFEVNVFALMQLSKDALTSMSERRYGHIINVSSGAARLGLPGVSAYSATKGAVHSFTQALRTEASAVNVRVTEVLPISVRTSFFDNVHGERYQPGGLVLTAEHVAAKIVRAAEARWCPPELLPFRPLWAAFVADALLPGLMFRMASRSYRRGLFGTGAPEKPAGK